MDEQKRKQIASMEEQKRLKRARDKNHEAEMLVSDAQNEMKLTSKQLDVLL